MIDSTDSVPVKHRDLAPFASASCNKCSGTGEQVVQLDRTRRSGKQKRTRQAHRLRAKAIPCPCGLNAFMKVQPCRLRVNKGRNQLVALWPFTHVTAETLSEFDASKGDPIQSMLPDHGHASEVPSGAVESGNAPLAE